MMKKSILVILNLFLVLMLVAQSPSDQFRLANEALEAGNTDLAIQAFESILDQAYTSENLLFNLGNACLQSDELGKAILYYEKALLLSPGDESILHNLNIARSKTLDDIQSLPPFFLMQWWQSLRDSLSSNMWSVFFILFLFACSGAFWAWLQAGNRQIKKSAFLGGIFFSGLALFVFLLALTRSRSEAGSHFGVVLAKEVTLHVAYDTKSKEILTLHEGAKVEIQERIGDQCGQPESDCWFKVSLANGEEGWLPFESMKRI